MSLSALPARKSFAFSAENPTGKPNGGANGGDCSRLRAYWYLDHPAQTPYALPSDREMIMR